MAKLQIDLSGRSGLAPRFWGDIDRTVATPELRILGKPGQMANGTYNPMRRYGYMSPANATFTDVSTGANMTTTLGSSQTWQSVAVALKPSGSTVPVFSGTASSGVEDTSDTQLAISHTVTGSVATLVVAVTSMTGSNPTSVTWDGTALTLAVSATTSGFISIWYLYNANPIASTVIANWATNTAEKAIHAMNFTGVSSNAINSSTSSSGTSTTATTTMTPTVENTMFVMATGSTNATHTQGEGQTERTDLPSTTTPFRYSTSTKGNTITIIGSSIYDSVNDDFYFAERGQRIFKGDTLDDVELAQALDLGTTGTPIIMDLEIYQVNAEKKLFYVYKTGGNMNVGIATLPFASNNNTWLTATVSGFFTNALTNDAFMRVADNGYAYLFQDNNVHKIDGTSDGGTNGTVSANILRFPIYYQIVDAVDYRGNMYIGIHQSTEAVFSAGVSERTNSISCGVYIWNRDVALTSIRDIIPLIGVKQIRKLYVSPSGELRLHVINSENISEIRKYNGSNFVPIEEIGYNAHAQYHDTITNIGGLTVWIGNNGNIYAHGKISPFDNEALYKIGDLPETNSSSGNGAILFGGTNTNSSTTGFKSYKTGLYVTYTTYSDGSPKIKAWDIYGTGASGVNPSQEQGDVYTLVTMLPMMSTVHYIDLYCFPNSGSGSTTAGTVKIYFNQSSTAWASKTITRDMAAKGYITIDVDKQYVNSIQIEIEFSTSSLVGSLDFAPSMAIVDYSITSTRG